MTATELLFTDARAALDRELACSIGHNTADDAFAAWLLGASLPSVEIRKLSAASASSLGIERDYHHVAVIGFAADAAGIPHDERDVLARHLQWLAGREPFPDGNPMGFCTDSVALLGIALGLRAIGDDIISKTVSTWTEKFLAKSYQLSGIHGWQRCLLATTSVLVPKAPRLAVPAALSVADVRVALRSKGLLNDSDRSFLEHDETQTLSLLKTEISPDFGMARAALRAAAFDWIKRAAPTIVPSRATIEDIRRMLASVSDGFRRWTWEDKPRTPRRGTPARQWHIDSEYHVQNLLYFLLAPIFPDLRDEEYFPSVGQKQPRTDLFIPSMKLIIEVKFVYERTPFQDIVSQVAEDASLYLAEASAYTRIIAFVWDNSRRTEEHGLLARGLKQITGVVDVIVVPRPGGMVSDTVVSSNTETPPLRDK